MSWLMVSWFVLCCAVLCCLAFLLMLCAISDTICILVSSLAFFLGLANVPCICLSCLVLSCLVQALYHHPNRNQRFVLVFSFVPFTPTLTPPSPHPSPAPFTLTVTPHSAFVLVLAFFVVFSRCCYSSRCCCCCRCHCCCSYRSLAFA